MQPVSYDASHGFNLTAMVPTRTGEPSTEETNAYVEGVHRSVELLDQVNMICPEHIARIVAVFEAVMGGVGKRVVAYNPKLRMVVVMACDRICQWAAAYDAGQSWLMPPLRAIEEKLMDFILSLRREACFRDLK